MAKDWSLIDKKSRITLLILGLVFVCDLLFIVLGEESLRFFSKTLLMPLLLVFYWLASQKSNQPKQNLFIAGLILSWFGDVFLLFDWGFIAGLGSFLAAHICYIFCLKKFSVSNALWSLPFILIYLFTFLTFLFPHLGDMKIPVILYALCISGMLYFSLKTKQILLIIGAVFFVISDSVLAINLFVNQSKVLGFLVMFTYVLAQTFLTFGFLKSKKSIT
ncbi:lysoplasmalogenase [Soonwooa sp.]|uniref:lysoplasmalogenase n=1 Tax=Soonwooa sp. TaxID=1938592 RepID=UPI0028AE36BF|nr:lysoplasmalogenase [Soonwooa sp.]